MSLVGHGDEANITPGLRLLVLEKLELIGFTPDLTDHALDFHRIAHLAKFDDFGEEEVG